MTKHWTERSTKSLIFGIASDFVRFVEARTADITQSKLAERLGVTEGSVSQFFNSPGNPTLKKLVAYARAIGVKVAIVAYDDNDPENATGLVPAAVFVECWERLGRPRDMFSIRSTASNRFIRHDLETPADGGMLRIHASWQEEAETGPETARRPSFGGQWRLGYG